MSQTAPDRAGQGGAPAPLEPQHPEYWRGEAEHISSLLDIERPGAPTRATDASALARLLAGICSGLSPTASAIAAGIGSSTLGRWRARARAGDRGYRELWEAIRIAKVSFEKWHLDNIRSHAAEQWTASAWSLQNVLPEKYRPPSKVAVAVSGQVDHTHRFAPIVTTASEQAMAQLRDVLIALQPQLPPAPNTIDAEYTEEALD